MKQKYTRKEAEDIVYECNVLFGPNPDPTEKQEGEMEVKLPFCGFYESALCAIIDDWMDTERYKAIEDLCVYGECDIALPGPDGRAAPADWEADTGDICDKWIAATQDEVERWSGIAVPLRFSRLVSPREYNVETDSLYAWADKKAFMQLVDKVLSDPNMREQLERDIEDIVTPREGRFSFYEKKDFDFTSSELPPSMYELIFDVVIPAASNRIVSNMDTEFEYSPVPSDR